MQPVGNTYIAQNLRFERFRGFELPLQADKREERYSDAANIS
jgi:hypothetical protein